MMYLLPCLAITIGAFTCGHYIRALRIISKIRNGCFIKLPRHAVPKYVSLTQRSFDLEKIPTHFFILLFLHEDDRFLTHQGFNIPELSRAIKDTLLGRRTRGGSSISQQTAKSLFTNSKETFLRKIVEAIGTVALERSFSKEEIVYLYLWSLKLISIVSGLPEIAHFLLERNDLATLTIDESEFLINLIPAPTARLTGIRKLGEKTFDFNYSYEKLLLLMRLLHGGQISASSKGLKTHSEILRKELLPDSRIYRAASLHEEELAILAKAADYMTRIEVSLKLACRTTLPEISHRYLLTHWQSVMVDLLTRGSVSLDVHLTQEEEECILTLATQHNILHLLSSDLAAKRGLLKLCRAIETAAPPTELLPTTTRLLEELMPVLSRPEIPFDTLNTQEFSRSLEMFFDTVH